MLHEFDKKLLNNNLQLALNKYGQNFMFPHSVDCATRRDYIGHRIGAVQQQMSFLRQLIDGHINRYNKSNGDMGEKLRLTKDAINQLSYSFDNLVFNLASLSEYFGNYIGLHIYGPKGQNLKWGGFVKKTNSDIFKEHNFNTVVASEHNEWFNRLHNYRGDIIHKKVILVEVDGFENKRLFPHTVENLSFKINDKLRVYFHLIRDEPNRDLYHCAERMCKRTFAGLDLILEVSETLEFDSSYKQFKR
jgi:hypothetical protein